MLNNVTCVILIVTCIFAIRYAALEYFKLKDREPPEEKKKKNSLPEDKHRRWGDHIIDDHIKEYERYLNHGKKGKRRHL